MRIERIRESVPKTLKLSEAEAAALRRVGGRLASDKAWWGDSTALNADRSIITCVAAGATDWTVRVHDAVGVVSLGEVLIVVEPKIPTSHLLFLFSKSQQVPRLDDQEGSAAGDADLWELVARWFVKAAAKVLRRDLARDYTNQEDSLKVVRGQIKALATARSFYSGRFDIDCRFDEFQVDTPLNRMLKAAARVVQRNPLLSLEVRRDATRFLSRLSEVGELRAGDMSAFSDRRTAYYSDAIALARHILKAVGRTLDAGSEAAWTFLIRTPELVENGVREVLRECLGIDSVTKKGRQLPGSSLTFNPDLVFDSGPIADIKYKRSDGQWNRADLYQVVAFATAFNSDRAGLMDFGDEATVDLLQVGPVEVQRLSWPCGVTDPKAASNRFCAAVEHWLQSRALENA